MILVTGCSGFIGGRVVARLVDGGHRVRMVARDIVTGTDAVMKSFGVQPRRLADSPDHIRRR